jgi:hypothetical protein
LPAPTAEPVAVQSAAPAPPPAPPPLASAIQVGNEAHANQLVNGFFEAQVGIWRWTAPTFIVKLAVPSAVTEEGGVVRLDFTLPKVLVAQIPSMTLKAKVANLETTKTFRGEGDYVFEVEVPKGAVAGEAVNVEFSTDKAYKPGGADDRSLGVIAKNVELVPKSAAAAKPAQK